MAKKTPTATTTSVNGKPVDSSSKIIQLDSPPEITVSGAGLVKATAKFNLTGPKRTVSRFGVGEGSEGQWEVRFPVDGAGSYYLTCQTAMDPPQLEIDVKVSAPLPAAKGADSKNLLLLNVTLAFNPAPPDNPAFGQLMISASGTVLNGLDPVSCTLTPINPDGTSRGPCQYRPASMNGNSWTVIFVPLPPPPVFQNPPPPNVFSGLHLLEATAANEGTISASGVPQ